MLGDNRHQDKMRTNDMDANESVCKIAKYVYLFSCN